MIDNGWCYNPSASTMESIIALDLETTGLDPRLDTIIEIGAVRFRGSRVEDTWNTLVNPGRPLHPAIVALTGINDAMLANAPRLSQVLSDLDHFVGDQPILGHNIRFDLGFLQPKGLFKLNHALDTYDLAAVLLPTAGRYGLAALASALNIPVRSSHRALDDAQTTRQIFLRFYDIASELPVPLLEEITRLGAEVEWGAGWVFDAILDEHSEGAKPQASDKVSLTRFFHKPDVQPESLSPAAHHQSLDDEEIAATLEPAGPFAKHFPEFEHRPQQVTMLRAVARAFSDSQHLLVEAGTGTGKSMAYLIPALHWASINGERVIISTNTINLQDQLFQKDIPDLRKILSTDYHAAILKGRANYLCPRRLMSMRQIGPRSAEEMRLLAKVLVWLHNGGTGDRSEINLPTREMLPWSLLSAEGEDCSADTCLEQTGGVCPYYQAHLAAESAHVVIVNHALLLADIATGNRVIPEYRYLIVDEAHHLEEATTRSLSFNVRERTVIHLLRDLGGPSGGLLRQVIELARAELPKSVFERVEQAISGISDQIKDCIQLGQEFFTTLGEFMAQSREGKPVGPYGQRMRIVPATRTLPNWSDVEIAWENMRTPLASVTDILKDMSDELADLVESGASTAENLSLATRITSRNLADVYTNLDNMIFEPDPQTIYWIEVQMAEGALTLHAAPLEVGPLVEKFLWHEKESVVMTSATLTTGGDFDYIRRRLNAVDADELPLGSPFDYETSTLLYLVNDIPEPAQRKEYQRAVQDTLISLCRETHGRTLVLFTSNDQLRRTARAISDPLTSDGVQVFEQSAGASRHALLESFRTTKGAVLLGTRSFWEGVDVPGEALSVLVIVRLPFHVPSDPIVAARSDTFDSPFDEYTVPEAVLRFRQGFGRLIRTQSDRGIVVVLDRRIISKSYGKKFVDSLPRSTVRVGSMADLPDSATRWLGI
jgi:DNA polymerase-3 subunit epsilon/ATP-dependent DNA helicase DinG